MLLSQIHGRMILDSRGMPTVEADVLLDEHHWGRAAVPSGASTGQFEALELRDGGSAWMGKGVSQALHNLNTIIAPAIKDIPFATLAELDSALVVLDGTPTKSRLGANSLLAVSLACARALAQKNNTPLFQTLAASYPAPSLSSPLASPLSATKLPVPLMNVINGGVHAHNPLTFQEIMIVPWNFPTFTEALRAGVETYHALKGLLSKAGKSVNVGDEGGVAPHLTLKEALDLLMAAIEKAGYRPGQDIALALDVAASEFYHDGRYVIPEEDLSLSSEELTAYYEHLVAQYPILSIEDGMADDDTTGWSILTQRLGDTLQLVGDDLFVTHVGRLQDGITNHLANSLLVKVNQIGTLTEAVDAVRLAQKHGYTTVLSHRSGETEDAFIADLCVGVCAQQIKTGGLARSERLAKYNQLLRIEETLGRDAVYFGADGFRASHIQHLMEQK